MKCKQIYLAGKVKGNKWNLIENINPEKAIFFSSDGQSKSSFNEEGGCYHGYEWLHYHEMGFQGWSFPDEDIIGYTINLIKSCDFIFAYIDKNNSYGSISEIAYASAQGKKIYMIINELNDNPLNEDEGYYDGTDFKDAYWFVSNFPGVNLKFVSSEEEAKELLENLCKLESPIEELFYEYCFGHELNNLTPQYKVGKYRTDFAIEDKKIAIEIDGHDYHKTKEQRTNDASRERYLKKKGWNVIRFTGSEIFKDIQNCFEELKELIK